MTYINYRERKIHFKIVYWGIEDCGKVENLHFIHNNPGQLITGSLESPQDNKDRLMCFNFMDPNLHLHGFKLYFHLYTDAEQASNDHINNLLVGLDAAVFVADSQAKRMAADIESLKLLKESLRAVSTKFSSGYDIMTLPYVLQLNKRDLPDAVPVEEMKQQLVLKDEPVIEAIADKGIGVYDTLKAISKLALQDLTRST
jgi:hypothetical protein